MMQVYLYLYSRLILMLVYLPVQQWIEEVNMYYYHHMCKYNYLIILYINSKETVCLFSPSQMAVDDVYGCSIYQL